MIMGRIGVCVECGGKMAIKGRIGRKVGGC